MKKFEIFMKGKTLEMKKPAIMGVLNITPDSFFDGGKYLNQESALKGLVEMVEQGARIVDIGGESTGPGSKDVSVEEEIKRIGAVFDRNPLLASPLEKGEELQSRVLFSVDTYKTEVARHVLERGADIINDVRALRDGGREMGELIAKFGAGVVLMYSKDSSARTTLNETDYHDVVAEIGEFLQKRIEFAVSCGIKKQSIIIDPGMGAFISSDSNLSLEILRRLNEFEVLGCPILIGASRKGFIGQILGGVNVNQRLEGGLACAAKAVQNGAAIIRTHDVIETTRFFKVWEELNM